MRFAWLVLLAALAVPASAAAQARRDVEVEVGPGETLWSLAHRFDVPIRKIREANGLHRDELQLGQHLRIPDALASVRPTAAPPAQHVVQDGETFSSIATTTRVGVHALQRMNPGVGERDLRAGMTLLLPDGAQATGVTRASIVDRDSGPPRTRKQLAWIARAERLGMGTTRSASQILAGNFDPAWKRLAGRGRHPESWRWPAPRGWFVRGFGSGRHNGHLAIDIMANMGQRVIAADSGLVAYADDGIRGYGKMVLILHPGGWATAYAHNSSLLVVPGQRVRRGQQIARIGQTGNARGPHVHFMWITEGGEYCDPLALFRPYGRHRDGRRIAVRQVSVRGEIPASLHCRLRPARIDDSAPPEDVDDDMSEDVVQTASVPAGAAPAAVVPAANTPAPSAPPAPQEITPP